jgi:hypothetical protein
VSVCWRVMLRCCTTGCQHLPCMQPSACCCCCWPAPLLCSCLNVQPRAQARTSSPPWARATKASVCTRMNSFDDASGAAASCWKRRAGQRATKALQEALLGRMPEEDLAAGIPQERCGATQQCLQAGWLAGRSLTGAAALAAMYICVGL